ncbi:hypothetical protein QFZ94_000226 [Paraburkholderia sp. JPY465]
MHWGCLKSTTPASTGSCGAGRPTAASTGSLRARLINCIRTSAWTSRPSTATAAKKGGDNLGYSGHKHLKGDKVVAFCDRKCNIIAPFVSAPGNRNESPLLRDALPKLTAMARAIGADLQGSTVSLDGVYDCRENRRAIFNRGMRPNIPENLRNRKQNKRGRKRHFDAAIFEERFSTIERVFAWEDTFRRLLLRLERISDVHYALKTLAYTMINLRHYCGS